MNKILKDYSYLERLKENISSDKLSEDGLISIIYSSKNKDIIELCIKNKNMTVESLEKLIHYFTCDLKDVVIQSLCQKTLSMSYLEYCDF